MRLIDADALKLEIACVYGSNPQYLNWLNHAPTVDAVPVIRCRDCKWYKTNYSWDGKEYRICAIEAYEPVRKADDFCSRAERKEE